MGEGGDRLRESQLKKVKRTRRKPGRDCGQNHSRMEERSRGNVESTRATRVQRTSGRRLRKPEVCIKKR